MMVTMDVLQTKSFILLGMKTPIPMLDIIWKLLELPKMVTRSTVLGTKMVNFGKPPMLISAMVKW